MNASRDQNSVPTLLAAKETDGTTVIAVCAEPTEHSLCVSDASTGSDNGPEDALRDENFVPTLMAVSSDDGVTPVVVYADSDGLLLIDSN